MNVYFVEVESSVYDNDTNYIVVADNEEEARQIFRPNDASFQDEVFHSTFNGRTVLNDDFVKLETL